MITSNDVFDSVRRGYGELEASSQAEILGYFSDVNPDEIMGHVNNIKGILFEQEYAESLAVEGIEAQVFEATNHPVTDIALLENGVVIEEFQLKATNSVSYINTTLEQHPDVEIVVTSEVASVMDSEVVIDSEISNSMLEDSVVDTLFSESLDPISPLSGIGWLFGLPF